MGAAPTNSRFATGRVHWFATRPKLEATAGSVLRTLSRPRRIAEVLAEEVGAAPTGPLRVSRLATGCGHLSIRVSSVTNSEDARLTLHATYDDTRKAPRSRSRVRNALALDRRGRPPRTGVPRRRIGRADARERDLQHPLLRSRRLVANAAFLSTVPPTGHEGTPPLHGRLGSLRKLPLARSTSGSPDTRARMMAEATGVEPARA